MSTQFRSVTLFLGAALVLSGCALLARRPGALPVSEAEAHITPAVLAAPVRFLASDLLEGRAPGTRGDRLARLYIASAMQSLGLQPGAPDGAWEQPFELIGIGSRAPAQWAFSRGAEHIHFATERDFIAASGIIGDHAAIDAAEVVFVGYGIQAPEYAWDDFKGADLQGKVLLMLNNDPDWDPALFAGKRRLYYGRWTYKYESAARQGAAGAIIIHTPESAGYPWQTVQTSWEGENSRRPGSDAPEIAIKAWITEEAARRLTDLGGRNLNDLVAAARRRDFAPVSLDVATSLHLHNRLRRYATANVLGLLPGRDPALRDQVVVYTAHHDHLGVKTDAAGRTVIYNGAVDNAAGVAQLLAVARAFTALPTPPRRSVLFLAVAAEEQGLLGSEYYASHPTVAPGRIVANVNFDGGNIWGRTRDVPVVGYGKSTLDRLAAKAAARQGRTLADEPFPEHGTFYRSDQFNFAKIGVPALYPRTGVDFIGRPPGWGRDQVNGWIDQHYHQASDDFDPQWKLEGMVDDARFAFWLGRTLAETAEMPAWVPGDEFEPARQRALATAPAEGEHQFIAPLR